MVDRGKGFHHVLEVRGEIEGGERESREVALKGKGRSRNSVSSSAIRRDWTLEELKGILEVEGVWSCVRK